MMYLIIRKAGKKIMDKIMNKNFEDSKLPQSKITGEEVNTLEILFGYFI